MDKSIDIIIVLFSSFIILLISIILGTILNYNKKRIKLNIAELDKTQLKSTIEIQEQLLNHISLELHDNICQIASLVKIKLNTIDLNNIIQAKDTLAETKELTKQLISDVKQISISLNSEQISKNGLLKSIELEINRLNSTLLFDVQLTQHCTLPLIEEKISIIIFRMIQETLNNSIKHSNASNIDIQISKSNNFLSIEIADNGVGFSPENCKTGMGLINLKSRAKVLNAEIKIISRPGLGTKTIINYPL